MVKYNQSVHFIQLKSVLVTCSNNFEITYIFMYNTKPTPLNPHVEKSLERMALWSMVPLETGTEDTSPPPPSVLEMKFEPFAKTYSNITHNMDGIMSLDQGRKRHEILQPFTCHHEKTEYNYGYHEPQTATPDPCTYSPNYNAVKPSSVLHKLPKYKPPHGKQHYSSSADVVAAYQRNMRDFDPKSIDIPDYCSRERVYPPENHVPSITLPTTEKVEREFVSPAAHIAPADPPEYTPPPVTVFDLQTDRKDMFDVDIGRVYNKAVEQRDKLRPRSTSKDLGPKTIKTPSKNKRVEFLDSLKQERFSFMNEIKEATTPKTRTIKKSKQPKRPKSTFDNMRPRDFYGFPGQREVNGEPKIPIDPIESYKKTLPRVKTIKIMPSPPPLSDVEFWTNTTRHHR